LGAFNARFCGFLSVVALAFESGVFSIWHDFNIGQVCIKHTYILIPIMEPDECGNEGTPNKQPNSEDAKQPNKEITTSNVDKRIKSKPFSINIGAVFGLLGLIGINFWEVAADINGFWRAFFHWVSLCSGVFGVAALVQEGFKNKRLILVASILSCIALAPISYLVWPFKLPWIKTPDMHSFKVSVGPSSNTPQERQWYVANGANAVYHCAALISFKNLLPYPILIESYTVEEEVSKDKWERDDLEYVSMAGEGGGAFFAGGIKDANEMIYTTFDEVISNKNIEPNETVRGWIFLKRLLWTNPLRFTVEDSSDRYYSEPLEWSAMSNPIQPFMIRDGRRHVDISTVPMAK